MDEVQRISACMLGTVAPASMAHEAVLGMEMAMLRQGWPVGRSLGTLPDVRRQLRLGRPAFRETVMILESRGLLDVRRGPGGGLFVGAPGLEDVANAVLMYLALAGETRACIEEFRLLVWRMVVNAAIRRGVPPPSGPGSALWGFAVDLAERSGNRTMGLLARLAEMLVRFCLGAEAPARDRELELAIQQGDLVKAYTCLDLLTGPVSQDAPVIALEIATRGFSLSGRKSAMAMAVRMARELGGRPAAREAEWETAERLGYSDGVVRQARRILQDFGIVRCRQGRKGAALAPSVAPTGVIRLLAPCIAASAASVLDNREAIFFLISCAPVLAARRVTYDDRASVRPFASSSILDAFEALTLENLLLELSGNPLLAIVVRSLGLATVFVAGDRLAPPDCYDVIATNRRILQAIEAGDVRTAGVLARVKLDIMQRPAESYWEVA
jgi:DNA-binding FadR family transcriptional regulator